MMRLSHHDLPRSVAFFRSVTLAALATDGESAAGTRMTVEMLALNPGSAPVSGTSQMGIGGHFPKPEFRLSAHGFRAPPDGGLAPDRHANDTFLRGLERQQAGYRLLKGDPDSCVWPLPERAGTGLHGHVGHLQ